MLTQRGNLYLRVLMPEAQVEPIRGFVKLAETAAQEALQLQQKLGDAGAWPTTSSMAWSPSSPASRYPIRPRSRCRAGRPARAAAARGSGGPRASREFNTCWRR